MTVRPGLRVFLSLLAAFALASSAGLRAQSTPRCDFYASSDGNGDGKSAEKPFRVERFWRAASPGTTLCLLDGTYADPGSMLTPPAGLSGSPDRPITIRALHEGKVLLDGQGKRLPIALRNNDWLVIEGVNACCSSATVVGLDHANHDVIRRVAAWDAADGNYDIFGVHFGEHNLLEDVAGWGTARKIFESSQGGNFTTIRRAWGRWEGSHVVGPKMVFTLAYNNYGMVVENAIGTWSGEKMNDTYVLQDYFGHPWKGRGEGTYQDHDVDQPYAIFGVDANKNDRRANTKLLGSLAYITAADTYKPARLVLVTGLDAIEIADTFAYVGPGSRSGVSTFGLFGASGATSLVAHEITGIGGDAAVIKKDWQTRNVLEGKSLPVYASGESPFRSSRGASLCQRYVDGAKTDAPLWPWPMNQRILEATRASGHTPVDVTAKIQEMLGPIPGECRATP